jgi:hypothetical protein
VALTDESLLGLRRQRQWQQQQQQHMARDKKAAQKQKPAKAAAVKADPKKTKKGKQGSYDSLRDPLDRCGCSSLLVGSLAAAASSRNNTKPLQFMVIGCRNLWRIVHALGYPTAGSWRCWVCV